MNKKSVLNVKDLNKVYSKKGSGSIEAIKNLNDEAYFQIKPYYLYVNMLKVHY